MRARIVYAPLAFDGVRLERRAEMVSEPRSVRLEDGWLHVVEFDQFGVERRVKSIPPHAVECVEWLLPPPPTES